MVARLLTIKRLIGVCCCRPFMNETDEMRDNRLILVGGGVRSGKSSFAIELARTLGAKRAFIATAEAGDAEMRERIACHRARRGDDFITIEAPLGLPTVLQGITNIDVVVIDCLTLWLSNILMRDSEAQGALQEVETLIETIQRRPFYTIVVTNEVGMGIVPESRLARIFRDVAGHAHQRLALQAEQIYFAALGVILRLRPNPVQIINGILKSEQQ